MSLSGLVQELNKKLAPDYKFKLDLIHSTPIKDDGKSVLSFLGYANTMFCDTSTVPQELKMYVNTNKDAKNLLKWINEKIFAVSLKQLLENKNPYFYTDLVRIRIATNKMDKLSLKDEQKQEWQMQLKEIYYTRRKVIDDYYLLNIAKLPF